MRRRDNSGLSLLSPRERDVLRLLRTGLLTSQVASNLGISVSTLNKHLASTRRKLGVKRTAHALLLDREPHSSSPQADDVEVSSSTLCKFASDLETCRTFDEAWDILRNHADRLGVIVHACGVSAEPPGMVTNGARAIRTTWPDEIDAMYYAMGGEQADPLIAHGIRQTDGFVVDSERVLMAFRSEAPMAVRKLGEALLDTNLRFQFHQPLRDSLTRAPLLTMFAIPTHAINDFRRDATRVREALRLMAATFWDFVQRRRLMAESISGLSRRQSEVLNFAARGFTVAETAEHMGVSVRAAEKTLAAARKRLSAPTTSAAVYRALVYRALT
jgi:DNA-binding CsgD family transcriptional regulator